MSSPASVPAVIIKSAKTMDWGGWLLGIWSAFIVGATGALGAAGGGAIVGVQGFKNYILLTGASGLTSGLISLAAYLHNHPAPQPWDGMDRRGQ